MKFRHCHQVAENLELYMPVPLVDRTAAELSLGFPATTVAGRARLQRVTWTGQWSTTGPCYDKQHVINNNMINNMINNEFWQKQQNVV